MCTFDYTTDNIFDSKTSLVYRYIEYNIINTRTKTILAFDNVFNSLPVQRSTKPSNVQFE